MLAEKLKRKRGKREALNPPSSFLLILHGQACRDGGGVIGGWRDGSEYSAKVENSK